MAFDTFLQIDSVQGESTDDKHKGWIEVFSFSHGVAQSGAGAISSTAGIVVSSLQAIRASKAEVSR